jgi:Flp pilus assembly pilin Flp
MRASEEQPMIRVVAALGRLVTEDEGQDLLEYGMLAVLIAIGAMLAVGSLGQTVNAVFWQPIAQSL